MTYYDPPSGWQFGFPKVYAPLPGETLEETLLRDGYPRQLMDLAMRATRFWNRASDPPPVNPPTE